MSQERRAYVWKGIDEKKVGLHKSARSVYATWVGGGMCIGH
jgi:hypothetical protein